VKVNLGCDGCIRRKTMFCPPSIECLALDDKPYYFDKNAALKEIERLNNIINELKYGIKELDNMFYETFRISQNGYYSISEWELKEFINKLQELKRRDNNETMDKKSR